MTTHLDEKDIIIGIHSIRLALENKKRHSFTLWGSDESLKEFKKTLPKEGPSFEIRSFAKEPLFQAAAQQIYQKRGWNYHRIPSSLLLEASPLIPQTTRDLFVEIEKSSSPLKLLALDRVSDVHNGAAIMRTAAFFGVHAVILGMKGHFGPTPSFYRMASGGIELLNIVTTPNLSRTIVELSERGVICLGLMEQGEAELSDLPSTHRCLVMGSEDEGLSHAVARVLTHKVRLEPYGKLSTLNVSVASAIAMERFF